MRKLALAVLALAACHSFGQSVTTGSPRLTVVISIDQFRYDYVERFQKYYLPAKSGLGVGGFQFLAQNGATTWTRTTTTSPPPLDPATRPC